MKRIHLHSHTRKIIHVDMDAFYASVEQRDNPDLRGKPLAVGGSSERGVVMTASYEARTFGVRSAMASAIAIRKCPDLIFVPPRFDVYKEVSLQIRSIFHEYTDLVEPLSLDEAYLDVTANKLGVEYAMDTAQEILQKIKDRTNLTASAGVSYNKFLAKIASDHNKPDGYHVVTPKMAERFIEQLPIEKFFGVGKVTAKKMHSKGIFSGLELKQHTKVALINWFGKAGGYYYNIARGIDERAVNPNRIRRSLGAERTFSSDLKTHEEIVENINHIADILIKRIDKSGAWGKTLTLKMKYADFRQVTRSNTLPEPYSKEQIFSESEKLLDVVPDIERGIRLIGLTVSNFEGDSGKDRFMGQLELGF